MGKPTSIRFDWPISNNHAAHISSIESANFTISASNKPKNARNATVNGHARRILSRLSSTLCAAITLNQANTNKYVPTAGMTKPIIVSSATNPIGAINRREAKSATIMMGGNILSRNVLRLAGLAKDQTNDATHVSRPTNMPTPCSSYGD